MKLPILTALVLAFVFVAQGVADELAKAAASGKSAVSAVVANWEQTKELVAKHKGKIVVVDLWSTWCQPCVKEFPHLVELQKEHGKDVVCISLNCNYIGTGSPEDERKDIEAFLAKKNAGGVKNLISSEADEALYKKVGIASIPVVQVYDRDGKLAKQFDNEKEEYGKDGFTYEKHVTPYVKKLVTTK